jgi:hypothetical protein
MNDWIIPIPDFLFDFQGKTASMQFCLGNRITLSYPEKIKPRGGRVMGMTDVGTSAVFAKGKSPAYYTSLCEVWATVQLDRERNEWGLCSTY